MYIKNGAISLIFRVIFIIVCGTGLVMKLIYRGFDLNAVMSDFSLISNALALIYFMYLVIARPNYERGFFRGAVTIYMIVTFVVYYFLNFGTAGSAIDNLELSEYLLYFAAPIMAFVDYLLFCAKGWITAYCPLGWVILPLIFNILVFIINKLNWLSAAASYFNFPNMNMIIALMVFLGISYLLFAVDNLLAGRRR